MGTTKEIGFQEDQLLVAKVAKAIGHPARIAILQFLLNKTSCVCSDIVEELPLAQATVSQHLKVLKEAGLIRGDIEPHRSCYCIDPQGWELARASLGGFLVPYHPPGSAFCCE